MDKIEFTRDELYEKMKYIMFCVESEQSVISCKSHAMYQDFLKDTDKHFGDCTKEPQSCSRCFLISIEIEAQNIVNSLFTNDTGWCGSKCIEECNNGEDGVKKPEENEQKGEWKEYDMGGQKQ